MGFDDAMNMEYVPESWPCQKKTLRDKFVLTNARLPWTFHMSTSNEHWHLKERTMIVFFQTDDIQATTIGDHKNGDVLNMGRYTHRHLFGFEIPTVGQFIIANKKYGEGPVVPYSMKPLQSPTNHH